MEILAAPAARHAGFTLVEAVIGLAVLTLLLTLGVPAFRELIIRNSMAAARNTVVSQLHLARSEALKRRCKTILCPSEDGHSCLSEYEWQSGILVFTDLNGNKKPDEEEPLLRYQQFDDTDIRIITSTGRRRIAYRPDGMAFGYNATFTFCDTRQQLPPQGILVSNSGRPRLTDKKSDGEPLSCE